MCKINQLWIYNTELLMALSIFLGRDLQHFIVWLDAHIYVGKSWCTKVDIHILQIQELKGLLFGYFKQFIPWIHLKVLIYLCSREARIGNSVCLWIRCPSTFPAQGPRIVFVTDLRFVGQEHMKTITLHRKAVLDLPVSVCFILSAPSEDPAPCLPQFVSPSRCQA